MRIWVYILWINFAKQTFDILCGRILQLEKNTPPMYFEKGHHHYIYVQLFTFYTCYTFYIFYTFYTCYTFFYFSYILYFLYVLYFLHLGCKCVQLFTAWGRAVHKVLSALTVLHSWHFVLFLLLHWLQTKWINRRGFSQRRIGWNECESGAWVKCILWVAGGILGQVGRVIWEEL